MNPKAVIVMLIGIFAVVLLLLGLQTTLGGSWDTIADKIALVSAVLVLFSIVIAAIIQVAR